MKKAIINKKAKHEYEILDKWETGIVLKGWEVKSTRERRVNFANSFAQINKKGEIFLYNLDIAPYTSIGRADYDTKRERKLLLHKSEIRRLIGILSQKGLTLVPLSVYFKKGKVKVEIGLAKGKKLYDKREKLKRKAIDREVRHTLKEKRKFY